MLKIILSDIELPPFSFSVSSRFHSRNISVQRSSEPRNSSNSYALSNFHLINTRYNPASIPNSLTKPFFIPLQMTPCPRRQITYRPKHKNPPRKPSQDNRKSSPLNHFPEIIRRNNRLEQSPFRKNVFPGLSFSASNCTEMRIGGDIN